MQFWAGFAASQDSVDWRKEELVGRWRRIYLITAAIISDVEDIYKKHLSIPLVLPMDCASWLSSVFCLSIFRES